MSFCFSVSSSLSVSLFLCLPSCLRAFSNCGSMFGLSVDQAGESALIGTAQLAHPMGQQFCNVVSTAFPGGPSRTESQLPTTATRSLRPSFWLSLLPCLASLLPDCFLGYFSKCSTCTQPCLRAPELLQPLEHSSLDPKPVFLGSFGGTILLRQYSHTILLTCLKFTTQ